MFKVSVLGVLGAVVVSGCTSSSCASCTFCTSRPSPGGGSSISYPSENIKLVKTRERGQWTVYLTSSSKFYNNVLLFVGLTTLGNSEF